MCSNTSQSPGQWQRPSLAGWFTSSYSTMQDFFVSCLRTGVALSSQASMHLFDACIAALDWRGSMTLVEGLASCVQTWAALLLTGEERDAAYIVNRIYVLLDICGLSKMDKQISSDILTSMSASRQQLMAFRHQLEKATAALSRWAPAAAAGAISATDKSTMDGSKSRMLRLESMCMENVRVNMAITMHLSRVRIGISRARAEETLDSMAGAARGSSRRSSQLTPESFGVLWNNESPDSLAEDKRLENTTGTAQPWSNNGRAGGQAVAGPETNWKRKEWRPQRKEEGLKSKWPTSMYPRGTQGSAFAKTTRGTGELLDFWPERLVDPASTRR